MRDEARSRFGPRLSTLAFLEGARAVAGHSTVDGLTDEQRSIIPHFRNPMRPLLASTADAMTKIAAVVDGFAMTREFWAGQGFDAAEVDSILSQVNANRNSAAIMSIMADGTSGGPGASQQAE